MASAPDIAGQKYGLVPGSASPTRSPLCLCSSCCGIFCLVILATVAVLLIPVGPNPDTESYSGGLVSFTVNGVPYTPFDYAYHMFQFSLAGTDEDWVKKLQEWFAGLTKPEDPTVGYGPGSHTTMHYKYAKVKEQLEGINQAIIDGRMKRENELALGVFNPLMWPETGRFTLGMTTEQHATVRPDLAKMFDDAQGERWSMKTLKEMWKDELARVDSFEQVAAPGHDRMQTDFFNPEKSKTFFTQGVLKVLHKVALDHEISHELAVELSALQTLLLLPAASPGKAAQSLLMWKAFGQPCVTSKSKFMEIYKKQIPKRFPDDTWDDDKLTLVASSILDAMLTAGGRSVPLALNVVMGYLLMKEQPEALRGVDFTDEDNLRALMVEAMRYHAPVTTVPRWVTEDDGKTWQHQGICLDRAGYDAEVFERPDLLLLNRSEADSIAWAEFALVDGKNADPNSHACPGKQLSIDMVIAFVKEYQAAGPWEVDAFGPDIKMIYYGCSTGFKVTKSGSEKEEEAKTVQV